jgi:hypothetical protein
MSVSQHDRDDYEEGLRDRDKGVFDQALNDILIRPEVDRHTLLRNQTACIAVLLYNGSTYLWPD